jgi:hypothetical protein
LPRTAAFFILLNSLFTDHPTIESYTDCATNGC